MREFVGKDMFFAFMDECYRIMKPDAWMHVVVPSGRSNRAFWDPTHRRFFVQETFLYLAEGWRAINRLDHYRCKCNFGSERQLQPPRRGGTPRAGGAQRAVPAPVERDRRLDRGPEEAQAGEGRAAAARGSVMDALHGPRPKRKFGKKDKRAYAQKKAAEELLEPPKSPRRRGSPTPLLPQRSRLGAARRVG